MRIATFRGDQVAAGAVVLTTLAVLLELRPGWSAAGHLAATAAAGGVLGLLVAGLGGTQRRPYVSAIVLCALGVAALGVLRLATLLGAGSGSGAPGAGTLAWGAAVVGLLAAVLARRHDAATGTLVAALAVVVVPSALVAWAFDPGPSVRRLVLLVSAVGLALAAVARRDRRPKHAAQLANAGGLALAALAGGPLSGALPLDARLDGVDLARVVTVPGAMGWGWELVALAGGFGLLAYGAVDAARGPVLVGLLALASFAAAAAPGASLAGWPLVLGLAAVGLLAVGLRPTTPAPPEPPEERDEPRPLIVPVR